MAYDYVASSPEGKVVKGRSDLSTKDAVASRLASQGLVVISIEEHKGLAIMERLIAPLVNTISHLDKVLFTKHLSIMLRAGLTLLESLDILAEQATTWRMKHVVRDLAKRVERGEKLSDALAQYPGVFTAFYHNIIRSGEYSGTMEDNLEHLAIQYTKDYELRKKIKSALTYPTLVVVAAAFIGFFFATYVLPQVAALFEGLQGVQLPWVTRVLLKTAEIAREHTFLSFTALVGGIAGFFWVIRRRVLAPVTHFIAIRVWIFGRIVREVNLARFALVFGTLLRSGVDIIKSLEVTSNVLTNVYFKRAVAKALLEVQRGKALSEVLETEPNLFPRISSRMIGVGERAGKLEEVLGYLADFYELEVENAMKNLSTLLEPVMLLIIGVMALGMAFAILIPIYNFVAAINRI
jgi:type IV pilus assembly protein PilC